MVDDRKFAVEFNISRIPIYPLFRLHDANILTNNTAYLYILYVKYVTKYTRVTYKLCYFSIYIEIW